MIDSIFSFGVWVCSIAAGSVLATLIVIELGIRAARRKLIRLLNDPEVQDATRTFITSHIVKPFESMKNDAELKELIKETATESMELLLKRLKEKK